MIESNSWSKIEMSRWTLAEYPTPFCTRRKRGILPIGEDEQSIDPKRRAIRKLRHYIIIIFSANGCWVTRAVRTSPVTPSPIKQRACETLPRKYTVLRTYFCASVHLLLGIEHELDLASGIVFFFCTFRDRKITLCTYGCDVSLRIEFSEWWWRTTCCTIAHLVRQLDIM